MTSNNIAILITIGVYLIGMICVGLYYAKKNKSTDDFYLGGRKLGPFVTAMSAEASDMSSWLLMGLPGVALASGIPEAFWTAAGLAIGTYINWLVVAKRLRNYSSKIGAITVPEFFSKRHGNSRVISAVAAIVIIVFFIPYTASGFNACGTLFSTLFGVNYFTAMIISAVVLVLYTTLGGFLAASFTDLIQSIIMTIALLVIMGFGISNAGGIGAVVENAKALPGALNLTQGFDAATGQAGNYGPLVILSTLAWGLGYFGMPHILLRFMAIGDTKKLKLSRRIATVWVVISMGVAIFIGFIGSAMIKAGAIEPLASGDTQRILIKIAELLGRHSTITAIVAGLIFAGILAATMSTADSQLLAASSGLSHDILKNTFGVKLSQRASMILARLTVIAIAVIGVIWAREEGQVFYIVSFAWGGFGATFGPAMLLSLFWKRTNKYGIIAGMIAGGAMVFIWKYLLRPLGGLWDIYELLPAFIISLVCIIVVSLITKAPDKETTDTFDAVKAEA